MTNQAIALAARMAALFTQLDIDYVVGGSVASAAVGEARATIDLDVAVQLDREQGAALLELASVDFYVPTEAAAYAIDHHGSFNLIQLDGPMKVDVFVLGDDQLDVWQMERRIHLDVPGIVGGLWITSPSDQVLRKLRWFEDGGRRSDRQWRDVLGILRVQTMLDRAGLLGDADAIGLLQLVDQAISETEATDPSA